MKKQIGLSTGINEPMKRISKEQKLLNAKRNLTRLIISINFLFIVTNLSGTAFIAAYSLIGSSKLAALISIVAHIIFYSSHSINILVYALTDKNIRKELLNTLFRSRFMYSKEEKNIFFLLYFIIIF